MQINHLSEPQSESNGINIQNERSLHSGIKAWYSLPGDRFEVKINNYIIDLVRDNQLFEIQTRNFSAIGKKLFALSKTHQIKLIHPISVMKWISRVDQQTNNIISKRKSPQKGTLTDIFDELISIPELINEENFSIEILLIHEEEHRCDDGKGSWRRKRISIRDRKLLKVVERVHFKSKKDFINLLPTNLAIPFSNKTLAKSMGLPLDKAQKISYSLKKMAAIEVVQKNGNEQLFAFV